MDQPKQLAPIGEEQESAAESIQARQHTNRPSRLSAVLITPPGAHSPPSASSPTAATAAVASSQSRPGPPKSPSSEGLSKLDKQVIPAAQQHVFNSMMMKFCPSTC